MLEVLRELVDALAARGHITGNRAAELHAKLDESAADDPKAKHAAKASADVPPGA